MNLQQIFDKCAKISFSKRADYTTSIDPHENFKRSAEIASWFPMEDKSFAVLIGTKLARLGSLLSSNRKPNNESIEDSFLDLVNYCALWAEFRTSSRGVEVISNRSMRVPLANDEYRTHINQHREIIANQYHSGFNGTDEQEKEYDSPLYKKKIAIADETRYFSEDELAKVLSLVRALGSRKRLINA